MSNYGDCTLRVEGSEVILPQPFGFHGQKRLFCFLPLPTENVPLPVYINGCFFVEKNRKSLHISSGNDSTTYDEELEWNKILLEDAVCKSYLNLVSSLPQDFYESSLDSITFNLWPRYL